MTRNLRPRSTAQYVSQQEWQFDEEQFVPARRYNVCSKFAEEKYREDLGLVREMEGREFTLRYVQEYGLTHPLVFRDSSGLGMKIPPSSFTVRDVKRLVGSKRVIDVMDTCTQEGTTMTMHEWTKYYETHPRQKLLNVISLEISCSKLSPLVEPPDMVRQLDWVELVWPNDLKSSQTDPTNNLCRMMYPKVQKYCLMSVAGCYTDFHLDFGGTSVWYHIVKGEKLFLLIPPTEDNYSLFQAWQMSCEQEAVFFAELVEKAQLIRLKEGDTFIMPSGWIHGVYTPADSLVFGGNFLHSFNISQQLRVAEMEYTIKVPNKFRYPFYGNIHWYVLMAYHQELTDKGVKVHNSETDDVTTNDTHTLWLKGVGLEKGSTSLDTGSEKCGPILDLKQDSPISCNDLRGTPCLSTYEKEGLITLVKSIKELGLFMSDVPPSLPPPNELLESLHQQLCSSSLEEICPSQPSGVSFLSVPPQVDLLTQEMTGGKKQTEKTSCKKQRTRKNLTTTTTATSSPKKHKQDTTVSKTRRRKRKTSSKHSVVVSLQLSLLSPPKSQDEDEQFSSDDKETMLEQFPSNAAACDCLTSPEVQVEKKGEEEFEADVLHGETPLQLTPDPSPSINSTPVTGTTPLNLQTPFTPPLISSSSPLTLVLEQESPCSLTR